MIIKLRFYCSLFTWGIVNQPWSDFRSPLGHCISFQMRQQTDAVNLHGLTNCATTVSQNTPLGTFAFNFSFLTGCSQKPKHIFLIPTNWQYHIHFHRQRQLTWKHLQIRGRSEAVVVAIQMDKDDSVQMRAAILWSSQPRTCRLFSGCFLSRTDCQWAPVCTDSTSGQAWCFLKRVWVFALQISSIWNINLSSFHYPMANASELRTPPAYLLCIFTPW